MDEDTVTAIRAATDRMRNAIVLLREALCCAGYYINAGGQDECRRCGSTVIVDGHAVMQHRTGCLTSEAMEASAMYVSERPPPLAEARQGARISVDGQELIMMTNDAMATQAVAVINEAFWRRMDAIRTKNT